MDSFLNNPPLSFFDKDYPNHLGFASYKKRITMAENDFLSRIDKRDEIRFLNYIAELVK